MAPESAAYWGSPVSNPPRLSHHVHLLRSLPASADPILWRHKLKVAAARIKQKEWQIDRIQCHLLPWQPGYELGPELVCLIADSGSTLQRGQSDGRSISTQRKKSPTGDLHLVGLFLFHRLNLIFAFPSPTLSAWPLTASA